MMTTNNEYLLNFAVVTLIVVHKQMKKISQNIQTYELTSSNDDFTGAKPEYRPTSIIAIFVLPFPVYLCE